MLTLHKQNISSIKTLQFVLLLAVFCLPLMVKSQGKINQPNLLNDQGEKTGRWIIYFDSTYNNQTIYKLDTSHFCLINFKNGKPKGMIDCFYPEGSKHWAGHILSETNMTQHGQVTYYHRNGNVSDRMFVSSDTIFGMYETYYPNGILASKGEVLDNQRVGNWDYFHENGKLQSSGFYQNGLEEGHWTAYHDNGKIQSKGDFQEGKREGAWNYYYPDGRLQTAGLYRNNLYEGIWYFYFQNGRLEQKASYKNDVNDGMLEEYYENGAKKRIGHYKKGIQHGDFTFYHDNDSIESKGQILNGNYEGLWKNYFKNGNTKSYGHYHEDKKQGKWIFYYEDGSLESEGILVADLWHGDAIFYHQNGNVRAKGKYLNDLNEGLWKYYNVNGQLTNQSHYKKGVRNGWFTYYFDDGSIEQEGNLVDNKKDGEWTFFHTNGQLDKKGYFKNDFGHGDFIEYYANGNKLSEVTLIEGKYNGYCKFYFENGHPKSEGSYSMDKRNGLWKYYHNNGQPSAIGKYENGQSVGEWIYYFDNGQLKSQGKELADNGYGFWNYYHPNGIKKSNGSLSNGKKDGLWTFFDSLGNETSSLNFAKGTALNYSNLYDSTLQLILNKRMNEALIALENTKERFHDEYDSKDVKKAELYVLQGDYHFYQDQIKQARKQYGKAEKHILKTKADTSSIYTTNLMTIGDTYYNDAAYEEALSVYQKAQKLIKRRPHGLSSEDYTVCMRSIANTYSSLGDNGKALSYLLTSQSDLKPNKSYLYLAGNYAIMSRYAFNLDMLDESISYSDSALSIAEKHNLEDHWSFPYVYYYRGNSLYALNQFDSALSYYQKALTIYETKKDTVNYIYVDLFNKLSESFYQYADYELADKYTSMAIAKCERNYMQGSWVYRKAIANKALTTQKGDAIEYLKKSLALKQKSPNPDKHQIGKDHLGLATKYEEQGKDFYHLARQHYIKAIELSKEETYSGQYVNANLLYGNFLRSAEEDYPSALKTFNQMLVYNLSFSKPDTSYLGRTHKFISNAFYDLANYDSVIYHVEKAIFYLEQKPLLDLNSYLLCFQTLANAYEDLGKPIDAQKYNFEMLAKVEEWMGIQNDFYALALEEIAYNFQLQGNYITAVKYYQQAVELRASISAKNSSQYLYSVLGLADALHKNQQYDESLALLEEIESSSRQIDVLTPIYQICLYRQSLNYESLCKDKLAEEHLLEALKTAKRYYGNESQDYELQSRRLAQFYSRKSRFDEAYPLALHSLQIAGNSSKTNLFFAWRLETLSHIQFNREAYTEAIKLRQQANEIYLKQTGESESYISSVEKLARIYRSIGQYETALNTFEQIANLIVRSKSRFSGEYGDLLGQIGDTYLNWRNPKMALDYYQKSSDLYDSLGVDDSYFIWVHNRLGRAHYELKQFDHAESNYRKSIQLSDSLWGKNENDQAHNNMAFVYLQRDEFEDAEKLWLQVGLNRDMQNETGLTKVTWLDNLAALYLAWGKMDLAEKYWTETIEVLMGRITDDFPYLSESGKASFWDAYKADFEYFNSYAIKASQEENHSAVDQMYNNQLRTKSLLFSTSTKERNRILNSGDSSLIQTFKEYLELKESLSKYYGYSQDQIASENIEIYVLEQQLVNLEKALSLDASNIKSEERTYKADWKKVQRELKTGEAAIEIIRFRHFHKEVTDSVIYAALIVTSGKKDHPELVILPNGNDIESKYLKAYQASIRYKLDDQNSYHSYWKSIDEKLDGIETIYLSRDGVYNQMNIGTLKDESGVFLSEKYKINLLSSTRDLLTQKEKSKNPFKTASLFGFPKYDLDHNTIEGTLEARGITRNSYTERALDISRFGFVELPGTKTETETIDALLQQFHWQTSLYLGDMALEEEVKRINKPSVLHIATHGFFLENTASNSNSLELGVNQEASRKNPLLRSGILLAGAAQTAQGKQSLNIENGIFTAYEAMNLDLSSTELVILSACETGRGEIKNGEGVYGLQRAFQIAGAESIIMSLWKVDDAATQLLMTSFYESWLNGASKSDALKVAQQKVRKKYDHPYYWGAFVMIGS